MEVYRDSPFYRTPPPGALLILPILCPVRHKLVLELASCSEVNEVCHFDTSPKSFLNCPVSALRDTSAFSAWWQHELPLLDLAIFGGEWRLEIYLFFIAGH